MTETAQRASPPASQQNPDQDPATYPGPQTWKLTIAYDGTDFCGWQIQPGEATIQGELQSALGRIVGESPLPQGSGRTDSGVHALAQVASFPLQARIPPQNLIRALNRALPGSIRVLEAQVMPETFHARHSAVAKTYEYRVLPVEPASRPICSPFLARYVYPYSWPLDLTVLNAAAAAFLGEHDFRSFAAADPDLSTRTRAPADDSAIQTLRGGPRGQALVAVAEEARGLRQQALLAGVQRTAVRTIYSSAWLQETTDGFDLLVYRVRGSGFLHHMVRNLVGTMLDIARGCTHLEDLHAILAANDRSKAGPTAPARGLFLRSVEYSTSEELFTLPPKMSS